ncbi:MAG: hypothetical protein M1828_001165 [Chrysothrix sp. TS-e1954]|nr:MAG: hypothetical protein M1828_001165 [Chrysothrix sp. TS-e1954]
MASMSERVYVEFNRVHNGDDLIPRKFTLDSSSPVIHIGRSSKRHTGRGSPSSSNAYFSSAVVSREHAELKYDISHKGLQIRDKGSLHGTSVNGQHIGKHIWKPLNNTDVVTIGSTVAVDHHQILAKTFRIGIKHLLYRSNAPMIAASGFKTSVIDLSSPHSTPQPIETGMATTSQSIAAKRTAPSQSVSQDEVNGSVYQVPDSESSDDEDFAPIESRPLQGNTTAPRLKALHSEGNKGPDDQIGSSAENPLSIDEAPIVVDADDRANSHGAEREVMDRDQANSYHFDQRNPRTALPPYSSKTQTFKDDIKNDGGMSSPLYSSRWRKFDDDDDDDSMSCDSEDLSVSAHEEDKDDVMNDALPSKEASEDFNTSDDDDDDDSIISDVDSLFSQASSDVQQSSPPEVVAPQKTNDVKQNTDVQPMPTSNADTQVDVAVVPGKTMQRMQEVGSSASSHPNSFNDLKGDSGLLANLSETDPKADPPGSRFVPNVQSTQEMRRSAREDFQAHLASVQKQAKDASMPLKISREPSNPAGSHDGWSAGYKIGSDAWKLPLPQPSYCGPMYRSSDQWRTYTNAGYQAGVEPSFSPSHSGGATYHPFYPRHGISQGPYPRRNDSSEFRAPPSSPTRTLWNPSTVFEDLSRDLDVVKDSDSKMKQQSCRENQLKAATGSLESGNSVSKLDEQERSILHDDQIDLDRGLAGCQSTEWPTSRPSVEASKAKISIPNLTTANIEAPKEVGARGTKRKADEITTTPPPSNTAVTTEPATVKSTQHIAAVNASHKVPPPLSSTDLKKNYSEMKLQNKVALSKKMQEAAEKQEMKSTATAAQEPPKKKIRLDLRPSARQVAPLRAQQQPSSRKDRSARRNVANFAMGAMAGTLGLVSALMWAPDAMIPW